MGLLGLKEHTVKDAKSIADAGWILPRNRDGQNGRYPVIAFCREKTLAI
jgi:hypothetical protein